MSLDSLLMIVYFVAAVVVVVVALYQAFYPHFLVYRIVKFLIFYIDSFHLKKISIKVVFRID